MPTLTWRFLVGKLFYSKVTDSMAETDRFSRSPEAIRTAKQVSRNPSAECPYTARLRQEQPGSQEAVDSMHEARPEYYGRLAAPIAHVTTSALARYEQTQQLGDVRLPDIERITASFSFKHKSLQEEWQKTLLCTQIT